MHPLIMKHKDVICPYAQDDNYYGYMQLTKIFYLQNIFKDHNRYWYAKENLHDHSESDE